MKKYTIKTKNPTTVDFGILFMWLVLNLIAKDGIHTNLIYRLYDLDRPFKVNTCDTLFTQ